MTSDPREYPTACLAVKRRIRRGQMCRRSLYGLLGAWWEYIVPEDRRTAATDARAASVLAIAVDPLRMVQFWIAAGEHEPWKLLPRVREDGTVRRIGDLPVR